MRPDRVLADHVTLDTGHPPRRHRPSSAIPIEQIATPVSGGGTARVGAILLQGRHGRHGWDTVVIVQMMVSAPLKASTTTTIVVVVVVVHGASKVAAQGTLDVAVLAAVVVVFGLGVEEALLSFALAVLQDAHLFVEAGHFALSLGHQGAVLDDLGIEGLQDRVGDARGGETLDVGAGGGQQGGFGGDGSSIVVGGGGSMVVVVVGWRRVPHTGGGGGTAVCEGGFSGFSVSSRGSVAVALSFTAAFLLLGATVASGVEVDLVGG